MDNRKDFEDIVSNSKKEEFVDLYSVSEQNTNRHYKKKKRKKMGNFKKAILIILSITLALIIGAVVFVTTYFDYNYDRIDENPENLGFENVIDKDVVNIALFGLDSRSMNFTGNSDSIMILSLNTETKQVKIISVMRDSLVKIEREGKTTYNKINSAYAGRGGGPELAIKTLNENFGLDISEYATVNFEGMRDIIDAVGGIEAELTSKEVVSAQKNDRALNGVIREMCDILGLKAEDYYITKPGVHHLNGMQAVAYSRIRYVPNIWGTNNDYGRTERQRYVMEQLFQKALELNKTEYIKLVKALIPCSQTSLSYTEIMGLALDILVKSPTFSQSRIPLDEYQMKGFSIKGIGSVVYYDVDYAAKVLQAYIYEDIAPEKYMEENGIEKNDWYSKR